jgi:hypothetical protein
MAGYTATQEALNPARYLHENNELLQKMSQCMICTKGKDKQSHHAVYIKYMPKAFR